MPLHLITPELRARMDSLGAAHRADAVGDFGTGVFFERQLEHLIPTVLEERLPVLNAARLLPVDTSVPPGAKTYTQRMFSSMGIARWISNYAADLPSASVGASEEQFKVKTCGVSYDYTFDDILSAQFAGVSLDARKGVAARRATEELMNRTAWFGAEEVGLHGALNYPYTPRVLLDNAIGSGTAADTIIAMLNDLVNGIHTRTKQLSRPDTMLLTPAAYTYMATTPRSTTSDTTILEFFLKKQPFIKTVEPCWEMEGAGPNGEDVVFVYERSARVIRHVVPMMFRQLPVQEHNLTFLVPCVAKSGGAASDYPLEMAIGLLP